VRRRIDRALNNSSGTIWFDRETYSIAKLNFELMEKMKIWWGVIGSISQMRGNFRSLHQKQILRWTDFDKVEVTLE
jgi:hypothetical protein